MDPLSGAALEKEFAADFKLHTDGIRLSSARNQYVSFQMMFDARDEGFLNNVELSFGDLTCGANTVAADYEVYIEWFHRVNGKYMPDLLIPYKKSDLKFKLPLDDNYLADLKIGVLWIDLFVPDTAAPGNYSGTADVTADGVTKRFDIDLTVYNCLVPFESRMIVDFNNYADSISGSYEHLRTNPDRYCDGSFFEVEAEFVKMAREHRCLFQHLNYLHSGVPVESFAPELTGSGNTIRVKSWELFDRHFGPYLDGSVFKDSRRGEIPIEFLFTPFNLAWPADYTKFGKPGYATEYRRIMWEFIRHVEEKGWLQTKFEIMYNHKKTYRFIPSTQDEIWYQHDEDIAEYMFRVIDGTYRHSRAQILHRADSSNYYCEHSVDKFSDMFDMYVAGVGMHSWVPESALVTKNKGKVVWVYGGFGGLGIQCHLHQSMSYPMYCFMTGATGFDCFWNAVGFGDDYLRTPLENGNQAVFFPGTKFGAGHVLPTIRLKALRNQMQTADLMMRYEGLEDEATHRIKTYLQEIINGHYGFGKYDQWWQKRPEGTDGPPRYWDFQNMETFAPHEGRSPAIIERIRNDVLKCLDFYNNL